MEPNKKKQESISAGCVPPACSADPDGPPPPYGTPRPGQNPQTERTPPPRRPGQNPIVDRQTPVKTLPCPKLRLRAVIKHAVSDNLLTHYHIPQRISFTTCYDWFPWLFSFFFSQILPLKYPSISYFKIIQKQAKSLSTQNTSINVISYIHHIVPVISHSSD